MGLTFYDPRLKDPDCRSSDCRAETGEEVRLHKVPGWLSKTVRAAFKGEYRRQYCPDSPSLVQHCIRLCSDDCEHWLDHWGTAKIGGRDCFVAEPYGLSERSIRSIMRFCEKCGLEFRVSATSFWFPTRTVRVIIFPPGNLMSDYELPVKCRS